MAAVTVTRLAKFVYSSIAPKQQIVQVHLWTDSQIVLHWIHKGNSAKPFISNHVQEICETFPPANWSYIPSADNPADLLTRDLSANQLRTSHLWIHGPNQLPTQSDWPTWTRIPVLCLQADKNPEPEPTDDVTESTEVHNILSIADLPWHSSIHRVLAVMLLGGFIMYKGTNPSGVVLYQVKNSQMDIDVLSKVYSIQLTRKS